ncbi:LytS/YhcK type 5TM receptor domain-containing protein [Salegentibacter sp. T436]|uniref:LytS/YhcK type 5TM receptor domain-containing protein n=1 Tax=Salegentibacter sp. T436 TaxID=1729720 RepID=UPI00094A3B1E|nr:LytS/YhcK type 5TM receptor domain-containing protein [Salegentibacter sp. T436]APS39592.1 hypothetical protein AO058_12185 [Salegentibacter sp. T436]
MDYPFFSGLIQNVALLLVFSFLYATKWIDSTHSKKLLPNVFAGIIVGGIGVLLMFTPWTYQPGHYFDLRTILLAIAGLYLGAVPTIIAILIIAAYRLYLGGDYVIAGVGLIIISGLLGIGWKYFQQRLGVKNSIVSLYLLGVIVHVCMLILPIFIPIEGALALVEFMALPILIIYPVITVLLGLLMNRQLKVWRNRKEKDWLYESEQRFTKMMLDINMVFINLDIDSKIIFCNDYLLSITGYTEEELIGKNTVDIFVPEDEKETTEKGLKELFENNRSLHHFESKILTKDNKELYISWYNSVITDDYGKIKGIASLGENITEKKATLNNLKEAKEKAEESNRLKSVFLQNISHEIRTPINAIMGTIDLLKESSEKEVREKYYEVLRLSGTRLLSTINDLIDISQVETRQIKVNKSNFNLSEIIANHLNVATPIAGKKNNKIVCTSKYLHTNTMLYTDKNMLTSIFINLLSNANKFTADGIIEFGSLDEHGNIVFYVKDNGIGIPENRIGVIFDRFVQADSSLSRPHEGSGLGLSIAKAYAEMLGGNIWVESEEDKGSTFYFSIPKDEVTTTTTHTNKENNEITQLPNHKILIAEDDKLNYLILKKIVENMGVTNILHAENGLEAVEMVKKDTEISLVLMDIKMPKMSGEEAIQKIRIFNPTIPIIAQTAFAMPNDRDKFIEIGSNDYIPKPIDKNELKRLLKKYLPAHSTI